MLMKNSAGSRNYENTDDGWILLKALTSSRIVSTWLIAVDILSQNRVPSRGRVKCNKLIK